ncbi:hypothetical protein LOK49_LG07G03665 [Camellia lanceoleosa]|uniref:Uncharacterized protein n=1 Tax=Camellia lanceoleosa TaxID=1840588 RepID=A0ACC0H211_9ERIC|nr:hypothetical protein LOK49_LG07G03665 [Camellia lanceoleosa]
MEVIGEDEGNFKPIKSEEEEEEEEEEVLEEEARKRTYTLFPLLLLLDAAVNCRSPPKAEESVMVNFPKVLHKVSDIAAEGVLQCLEELLKKCHLGSVDQVVVLLKKLTYAAMLSPTEVSEEFREGVFRCFRALLLSLHLCSNKFCSCKQINGFPALLARRDVQSQISILPRHVSETEECLLAFLHSQAASAAIGHWLSLLLKVIYFVSWSFIEYLFLFDVSLLFLCTCAHNFLWHNLGFYEKAADIEVARGHRGSAKLRVEAFMTLRILVAKLCVHSAKKVRQGLLAAIRGLLSKCIYTLKDSRLMLLVSTARFLDVFALCLGQNSVFAGSLKKLTLARPASTGYLHSITEMRASIFFANDNRAITDAAPSEDSKFANIQNKKYYLPRMPPWFVYVGSQKLYQALAGILRLVGLSLMADSRSEGSLSIVTDVPLDYLRKLVSEASTAVCILNEIIFGVSDKAVDAFARMFHGSRLKWEEIERCGAEYDDVQVCKFEHPVLSASIWKISQEKAARSHLIDSIGRILHEYLSPEVWSLPLEHKSSLQQPDSEVEDITLHFFHDAALLYQEIYIFLHQYCTQFIECYHYFFMVIIDGIGIFSMCLGNLFSPCGFLHSSLYVLLENIISSNFQIRSAADSVLHVISTSCGYPTTMSLIPYVDSYAIWILILVVPNVLAAMLSYIGVAHQILPLLEEPMRSVSLELEILGRHQHPDLTIPFLKAVAEINKASKREACSLPLQAAEYLEHVKSKMSDFEKKTMKESVFSESSYDDDIDMSPMESEVGVCFHDVGTTIEQWESVLFKLNDSKRYRRTVGSIAGSCDGIMALAKVEEAYKHERETKEAVERVFELCSFHTLKDTLDAAEDGTDENRLLPAMNKIWPFLVACIRNKNPLAVRRCTRVISNVVRICGGDFFSRRFYTDGPHFWKLLTTSPFQTKPVSKEERTPLQLPYRSTPISSEVSMAEVSNLKVQAALLDTIADLSREKKSASALEAVLKKVSGLVVGIACSGVVGLREASVNALVGLASMDPDLIWLLLADVYYSKKKDVPSPPTSDLPEVSQILPPPSSPKDYLYVQYGGQSYGFEIDFSSVETVFRKLNSQVFISQPYS